MCKPCLCPVPGRWWKLALCCEEHSYCLLMELSWRRSSSTAGFSLCWGAVKSSCWNCFCSVCAAFKLSHAMLSVPRAPGKLTCWIRACVEVGEFNLRCWTLLCRWTNPSTNSDRGRHDGLVLQRCLGSPCCHQCLVGLAQPGEDTPAWALQTEHVKELPYDCRQSFSVWDGGVWNFWLIQFLVGSPGSAALRAGVEGWLLIWPAHDRGNAAGLASY